MTDSPAAAHSFHAFYDGKDLRVVELLESNGKSARLLTTAGKRFNLDLDLLLFPIPELTGRTLLSDGVAFEDRVAAASAAISITDLWRLAPSDAGLTVEELLHRQDPSTPPTQLQLAATFRALAQEGAHFQRRLKTFHRRPLEEAQALLEQRRRQAELAAFQARLDPWLRSVLAVTASTETLSAPAEFDSFITDLEALLWEHHESPSVALFQRCASPGPLRQQVLEFLQRIGRVSRHADSHLALAGLREEHPAPALAQATSLRTPQEILPEVPRRDLSGLTVITIDDQQTMDVDDGLSLERLPDGLWRLGVHIADVAAFVSPGSALDQSAAERSTSIYLPDRTVHMFPAAIAHATLSLLPGMPRPAMSFMAVLNEQGELLESQIYRSLVQIRAKLAYDRCDELIQSRRTMDDAETPLDLQPLLQDLHRLSLRLQSRRQAAGAIAIPRPDIKITLKNGVPDLQEVRATSPSRFLVSEAMVLGNGIAAAFAKEQDLPFLYRAQEIAPLPVGQILPQSYDPIICENLLKHLKKTSVGTTATRHASLGLDCYAQLTSPIRRFLDLVLQRQLAAALAQEPPPYSAEDLQVLAEAADERAGRVRDAQRGAEAEVIALYFQRFQAGRELEALLIRRDRESLTVELRQLPLRIKLRAPRQMAFFNPGDPCRVRIIGADPQTGEIEAVLASAPQDARAKVRI